MKRNLSILFITTMLCMVFVACGSEKDEPDPVEKTQLISSVFTDPTDTHYTFDIDLDKDSSSIYLYNIVFRIGETTSPAMNIRIDAPVTVDKSGKVYTYSGNNIVPYMLRGQIPVPMVGEAYLVNNLYCTVNTADMTFAIRFDCHGGHHDDSGTLQNQVVF